MTFGPALRVLLAACALAAGSASAFIIVADPQVLEYYNTGTGHYLLLSDPAEIAGVDRGAAGPGWVRTGYSFASRNLQYFAPNVCRFYSRSSNSHFFTADPAECGFLRTHDTGWAFEKLDFSIDLPVGGACPDGLYPVYRMYNDRWMFNDSNHRFSTDPLVRDAKVASGWTDEGIAFCTKSMYRQPDLQATAGQAPVRSVADCENEAITQGACVAVAGMAPPANRIASWLPPFYVTRGPLYSARYTAITGFDGDVFTSQPPDDTDAVVAHSFAQTQGIVGGAVGVHLVPVDRSSGDIASISAFYQFTTSPTGGATDARVFPWRAAHDNDLVVSFQLDVRSVARQGDGQGYGSAVILFRDARGGRSFYVTLQAYGTPAPADFTGIDIATGRVIVSTVFRPDPAFGTRLRGDYLHCADDPAACRPAGDPSYAFRLNRAEFLRALQRARALDPALSADAADYLLSNAHFRNEIYRAAEIGMSVNLFRLEIYPAY